MWSSPAHDRVDSHEQFNSNHFGLLLPKWFLFSKNLSTRLGASLFIVQNRGKRLSIYGDFNVSAHDYLKEQNTVSLGVTLLGGTVANFGGDVYTKNKQERQIFVGV